ncbi:putative ABC transporter ATP-binding protein [Actinacidiphila reveromycinica]|uniref:Putative ABC transporter ATP-binding protein n=1 Tax=Actinacidiphila reveromycinica TaxID=659352 RepID=A0A7U3UQZ7_9ACTN|nr:putative ABC transporter ATP-binding protein [Streptomyces sp. SN-593]
MSGTAPAGTGTTAGATDPVPGRADPAAGGNGTEAGAGPGRGPAGGPLARLLRRRTGTPPGLAPGEVALTASGLGYRAGPRWLVRDVDLELVAGRVLAVIGPNGAGKSTLLSLLAGDTPPSAGAVRVGGLDARRAHPAELARRRAVLPQQPLLSFPFTAVEVVAMGRAPWAGTEREDDDEAAVEAAVSATGLRPLADRAYPGLSGGEQAATSFARVLAQRAGVLLLDEPTAALDLRHQEQLMRLAAECAAAGQAVLVVLHDIQLAAAYADEIAVLAGGRLVARGSPGAVLTEALLEDVYGLPVEVLRHPGHGALLVVPRRAGRASGAPGAAPGAPVPEADTAPPADPSTAEAAGPAGAPRTASGSRPAPGTQSATGATRSEEAP